MSKIFKLMSVLFVAMFVGISFGSCKEDDDETLQPNTQQTVTQQDPSDAVAGTYAGKMTIGGTVTDDAYVVRIERQTSTTITMHAKFMGDESAAFVVEEAKAGGYELKNSSLGNITAYVSGKTLTVNYLTQGGYMASFVGTK